MDDLTPFYLRAMDRIARGVEDYSCAAISIHYNTDRLYPVTVRRALHIYIWIFSPNRKCGSGGGPLALAVNSGPDPKGHRLLMLALASVCWRDFLDV